MLSLLAGCDNKPEQVEITGRFSIKGNAPFTHLVFVSTDGKSYRVHAKDAAAFNDKQKGSFKIRALAGVHELESVDGKFKRKVHYIKDIEIICEMK